MNSVVELTKLTGQLGKLLTDKGLTIATAESCTGGLLATTLTDMPGSSAYFIGGVVTYTNKSKVDLLSVSTELLHKHGAVSQEVAVAMATEVTSCLQTNWGIGITGVAGPDNLEGKPPGLIFVALVQDGRQPAVVTLSDDQGRNNNRIRAVEASLRLCIDKI